MHGEEDGDEREAYASVVIVGFVSLDIGDSLVLSPESLVKEAVDAPVELTEGAWLGFETEGDVKGSVSGCFDQDQVGQS